MSVHIELVNITVARGDWGDALLAAVEIMLLALPSVGLSFFLFVLARGVGRLAWRRLRPEDSRRIATGAQTPPA